MSYQAARMNLMLAGKAPDDLSKLRFPGLVSPKLDGIRAYVENGRVMARPYKGISKEIPNVHVQAKFGKRMYERFDGELVVGDPCSPTCFNDTQSVVMSDHKMSDEVCFYVFDKIPEVPLDNTPFSMRLDRIFRNAARYPEHIIALHHMRVNSVAGLQGQEQAAVDAGYEGIMWRDPNGVYKFGRSTTREGGLLKIKRFEDAEALVIGFVERMHNANEKDARGKRTTHAAGKVGRGDLGALSVEDVKTKQLFQVGSGFTDAQRKEIWKNREDYVGAFITYKFQPAGVKDLPRFPTFKCFREV